MRKLATCLALLSIVSMATASFAKPPAKPHHVNAKAGHHHHHHQKPKPPSA